MKSGIAEDKMTAPGERVEGIPNQDYVSTAGVRIKMVNGEPMFRLEDIQALMCEEIARMPKETRPNVQAAQDARKIITELTEGIGADIEKFKNDSNRYLQEIRQTRYAMVSETKEMLGPLREVREFFLGPDYKEQIARLREFVDLCERLNALKNAGFLDRIADTMLKLA